MMKNLTLTAKELQMLELLAQGGTSKTMALNMGFKEGTMRVYLHHLYRKQGVTSKTRAATWYLANASRDVDGSAEEATPARGPAGEETVGDMALRTSLLAYGCQSQTMTQRVTDQLWLRTHAWPKVGQSVPQRDRVFDLMDGQDLPPHPPPAWAPASTSAAISQRPSSAAR